MKPTLIIAVAALSFPALLGAPTIELPRFPAPPLVQDGGSTAEIGSVHLLRDLHAAGLHGMDNFDAADGDYVLLRADSLRVLSGWLESACAALGYDLRTARSAVYDGSVFARLADVAASLGLLREAAQPLAIPIGVIICRRGSAWGELPSDQNTDAYVLVDTDEGMLVYDPPTRQLSRLEHFPNKNEIIQIRF